MNIQNELSPYKRDIKREKNLKRKRKKKTVYIKRKEIQGQTQWIIAVVPATWKEA
jgi:hypothetical protein